MPILLIALLFASTVFAAAPHNIWEPPFYNGVAAQVDKTLITYDDLRREMAPLISKIRATAKDEDEFNTQINDLYDLTLKTMVERALLVDEFYGRYPDPKQVAEINKMVDKDANAEFQRMLKDNFGGKLSDMVAALQQQGMTLPSYRKNLREEIIVNQMQSKFRHELPGITPDQVAAYYKDNADKFAQESSVKLSVITFKPITDEPVDVIVQTAAGVRQKIIDGGDFDKLATENNQEGKVDWGWMSVKDLADEISEALENVKAGEMSQPLIVDGKVLLVKVDDRKSQGVEPLANVQDQIKQKLTEDQAMAAYDKWIEQLKKKFFVKINDMQ